MYHSVGDHVAFVGTMVPFGGHHDTIRGAMVPFGGSQSLSDCSKEAKVCCPDRMESPVVHS
jgi:hypothetical protein